MLNATKIDYGGKKICEQLKVTKFIKQPSMKKIMTL